MQLGNCTLSTTDKVNQSFSSQVLLYLCVNQFLALLPYPHFKGW